jgi:hypothetical protein
MHGLRVADGVREDVPVNLVTSDRGNVMLRRQQQQLDAVREGRDPPGVSFDPEAPPVRLSAGNFVVDE